MSLYKLIKSDLERYQQPNFISFIRRILFDTNFTSVFLYRISHQLYIWRIPILPKLFMNINKVLFSAEINYSSKIGSGFRINHSIGIVIGAGVKIGDNFTINQGVTLGGNFGKSVSKNGRKITQPQIGNNLNIGSGAKVIGPVFIGDNVIIGANSVVLNDIEDNCTVVGIPAKVINDRGKIKNES